MLQVIINYTGTGTNFWRDYKRMKLRYLNTSAVSLPIKKIPIFFGKNDIIYK